MERLYQSTYEDLSRSKIISLPNHRKEPLGNDLSLYAVLQAIEIDRLSSDLADQRHRLKEFQNVKFNTRNLEVQIKQLTQRYYEQERNNSALASDNQKLNLIIHQLYSRLEEQKRMIDSFDFTLKDKLQSERSFNLELKRQIQKWRDRFMALQKSKSKELEEQRLAMQSQRRSVLDRQLTQLSTKHSAERMSFEREIKKLRDGVQSKNRQIQEYLLRTAKLQTQIRQLRLNQLKIQEYQGKVAHLSHEILRLNEVLKLKQSDNDSLTQRILLQDSQLSVIVVKDNQISQLKSVLGSKHNECQQLKRRMSGLNEQLNVAAEQLKKTEQLSLKLKYKDSQIQRANSRIKSKIEQFDQARNQNDRLKIQLVRYQTVQRDLEQYQQKNRLMSEDNLALNQLLVSRLSEIEELKSINGNLIQEQKRQLKTEEEMKEYRDLAIENTRLAQLGRKKIMELQADMRVVRNSLKDKENAGILQEAQIDRLNKNIKLKQNEIQDLKLRFSKAELALKDFAEVSSRLAQEQSQRNSLVREIQRLNALVSTRAAQVQSSQRTVSKLQEQVRQYSSLQSQLKEAQQLNSSLINKQFQLKQIISKQINDLQCIRTIQISMANLRADNERIVHEKDVFINQLRLKQTELQQLQDSFARLNQDYSRIYHRQEESGSQIASLAAQRDLMSRSLGQLAVQLQQEKRLSNEMGTKIMVLGSELQRVCNSKRSMQQKYCELYNSFSSLKESKEKQSSSASYRLVEIQSKVGQLQGQLQRMTLQINKHSNCSLKMDMLYQEYNRVTQENESFKRTIENNNLKYSQWLRAEKERQSYCLTMVLMGAEIQSLRSRVNEKEHEVDDLRKSMFISAVRHEH